MKKLIIGVVFIVLALPTPLLAETEISGGFSYHNVSLKSWVGPGGFVKMLGEVTNKSGRNYSAVAFSFSVYDDNGKLMSTGPINILNFLDGQTRTFTGFFLEAEIMGARNFKIQFEFGS